ncbi:hypothetical protein KBC59_00665 [Patescibacteria group bacterium]|nr:hypothetical protein [Patescibacteria group bacterium]
MDDAKVIKITKILVRDIPALALKVSRAEQDIGIQYKQELAEYRNQTVPSKRILLVRGHTAQEAFRVAFVLGLYEGMDVVALRGHDQHHYEVTVASSTPEFPCSSHIGRNEVHAFQPAQRSA